MNFGNIILWGLACIRNDKSPNVAVTDTSIDSGYTGEENNPVDTAFPEDSSAPIDTYVEDTDTGQEEIDSWSVLYEPDDTPVVGLKLVDVLYGHGELAHGVQSKIYPEAPDVLFVTLRGGGFSTFDLTDPAHPTLLGRWNHSLDVEGQDRKEDVLVVVARYGALLTFDVSDPSAPVLLAELPLETNPTLWEEVVEDLMTTFSSGPFGALHTKLYDAADGNRYAFVTAPETGELIAVDVSDPVHPVQVGALDTQVQFIEGIYIYQDRAFHGGFGNSGKLVSVDISDPYNMVLVDSLADEAYCQMVSEMKAYMPDVLFAALWENPGGLGTFDVSDENNIVLLDSLLRPELAKSNRVKLFDSFAVLPLEQDPGGVAIIDVSDVSQLKFVGLAQDVFSLTMPYTAEVKENYLYAFSAAEEAMVVFEILRGEPVHQYFVWDFQNLQTVDEVRTGLLDMFGNGLFTVMDKERFDNHSTLSNMYIADEFGYTHLRIDGSQQWDKENGLVVQHGLENLFYGSLTSYTLVWDIVIPSESFSPQGCTNASLFFCNDIPLFQLDRTNTNDAELFLKVGSAGFSYSGFIGKSGDVFTGGGLNGYSSGILPDTWHRIAFVVDLYGTAPQARIYIDGGLVQQIDQISYPLFSQVAEGDSAAQGLLSPPDSFLLFADNNGEFHTEVGIRGLMFADRALSPTEVYSLGTVNSGPIPQPF